MHSCRDYHVLTPTVASTTSNHIFGTLSQLSNYQNTTARLDNTCCLGRDDHLLLLPRQARSNSDHAEIHNWEGHAVIHAPSCRFSNVTAVVQLKCTSSTIGYKGYVYLYLDRRRPSSPSSTNSTATASTGTNIPTHPCHGILRGLSLRC